jgi:hypothetical protein
VTYCRIRNTLELVHVAVSETLVPTLYPNAKPVSPAFEVPLTPANDLNGFETLAGIASAYSEPVRS